jgi:hypothetical protein
MQRLIIQLIIFGGILAALLWGFHLLNNSYEHFLLQLQQIIGNPDLKGTIANYVSIDKFILLKKIFVLACICYVLIVLFVFKKRKIILHKAQEIGFIFYQDVRLFFSLSSFSKHEKSILCICMIAVSVHSIYYIHTWYLQHDECWTYNYFVRNHFIASFATPNNNHNFYTLISWLANLFLDGKWAIRIVALMGGLISIFVFAKVCKQFENRLFFAFAMILFSTSMPLLNYSVSGRSYSFTILFAAVGVLFIQYIRKQPMHKKYYYYFGISQALGVFSNFGYLYPLFGFGIFSISLINKNTLLLWVKTWCLTAILGIVFLGVPLLLLNGISVLAQAASTNSRCSLHDSILEASNSFSYFYTGFRNLGYSYLIIFCLLLLYSILNKNKFTILSIIQLFLPFFYCILHRQILFHRLFTYEVVFVSLIFAHFLSFVFSKVNILNTKWQYSLLLIFPVAFIFFPKHFLFNWSVQIDKATKHAARYMISKNIDTCYNFYFYPAPALQYNYYQQKQSIYFIKANKESVSYQAFDSNQHYQSILTATEDKMQFKNYHKTTIDGIIDIWE